MKIRITFLSYLLLLITFQLKAQDNKMDSDSLFNLSLEDLMNISVTTASKTKEDIQSAPAIINVVSAKDMEAYGAINLTDILDRLTSVYLISTYFSPDGMVSMRGAQTGLYNTKVLILLDGRPMRESFHGGYNGVIYSMFPIDQIERIEVIRGPGSVLYGTGAYVGVINLVTKSVIPNQKVRASAQYGQFNTKQGSLSYGDRIGEWQFSSSLYAIKNDGWNYTARGETDVIRNKKNTADSVFLPPTTIKRDIGGVSGLLNLKYRGLTFNNFIAGNDWATMNRTPVWPNPLPYRIANTRYFSDLTYSKEINEFWTATLSSTYNYFAYRAYAPGKADDYLRRYSSDLLLEFTNYFKPFLNFNLVVGGLANIQSGKGVAPDTDANGKSVSLDSSTNPNPWNTVPQYGYTWYSGYFQCDYKPSKNVKIIGGAQVNKIDGLEANVSPRLGLIISANQNLGWKILYGNAFRSPSAFERYSISPNSVAGNSGLTPERISTFESQIFYNHKKFGLSATYFYNHDSHTITRENLTQTINGVTVTQLYVNGGFLNFYGVELEGKATLGDATLTASFTHQNSKDDLNEEDHTGIPLNIAKMGVQYPFNKWASFGIYNSYYGHTANYYLMNSTGTIITKIANPEVSAYSYMSVNIKINVQEIIGKEKFPSLTLGLFVNNVLDQQVYYPELARTNINSLPGRPGRSVYGSLLVKF